MQNIDRVVRTLAQLSSAPRGLSITELHQRIDVPKSSLHRILTSLLKHNYVAQDEVSRKYKLGFAILGLGANFLYNNDLREIARPHLEKLGQELNETVHLTQLQNKIALCIDTYETSRDIKFYVQVGRVMPFHTAAAAKILLAYQTPSFIKSVIKPETLVPQTKRSITDFDTLVKHLKEIRLAGYAVCDEEMEEGVTAIAAPIKNLRPETMASVTVIGPSTRLDRPLRKGIVEKLRYTANRIALETGYSGKGLLG